MSILARLERSTASRKSTMLSIVGIILVPLVIAGILVWALWNPQERLGQVRAAIVNDDKPITLDGQLVPLGRQLSAGLVGSSDDDDADADGQSASSTASSSASDDSDSNYTWVITNKKDAAQGLKSGEYTAVVTIPENFSAAATSFSGDAADAERAQIQVTTSDRSKLVDDAITRTITGTATTVMGRQLTTTYLDNVYLGFNTLGDQLGKAADGAGELATGGTTLASAAKRMADGTTQLSDGAAALADGASGLSDGATALADGASGLSDGAASLADGASQLRDGTTQLSDGISALNAGAAGDGTAANPGLTNGANSLSTGARGVADGITAAKSAIDGQAADLTELAQTCPTISTDADFCRKLAIAAGTVAAVGSGPTPDGGNGMTDLAAGAGQLADGAAAFAANVPSLADGISRLADAAVQLADGAAGLADGTAQLSDGATQLSDGATQLSDGAVQLSDGASTLSTGTTSLASGATQLSDGTGTLSGGIVSLSSGLTTAVDQLPSYTASDRKTLSEVVAEPISSDDASPEFGVNGAPFYATLALWLGAFATFLVLKPMPRTALGSTRSSLRLALRAFAPAAVVGALQGLLVAAILSPLLELSPGSWLGFAGVTALVGVAFAAANQALGALFGGAGRFVSMLVGLVGLTTGLIATTPPLLDGLFSFLPLDPALNGLQAIVNGEAGAAGAVTGLVLWLAGALAATTLAVARHRTVSVRQLAPAAA